MKSCFQFRHGIAFGQIEQFGDPVQEVSDTRSPIGD
jgi:hypothetical protein